MPLYEFRCKECGMLSEILVLGKQDKPGCKACGSKQMVKQMSMSSSMSGSAKTGLPGAGDTACCGSSPDQAGCAGPGSCCGKRF